MERRQLDRGRKQGRWGGSARPTAESKVIITALARSIVRPNPAQPVSIHPRLGPLSASWESRGEREGDAVKEGNVWRQESVEERDT